MSTKKYYFTAHQYTTALEAILKSEIPKPQEFYVLYGSTYYSDLKKAGVLDAWFEEKKYLLEHNTWHVHVDDENTLLYHTENGHAWGWKGGKWVSYHEIIMPHNFVEVNHGNTIWERLKSEAQNRGLVVGAIVKYNGHEREIYRKLYLDSTITAVLDNGAYLSLMQDGKWIKPVSLVPHKWYKNRTALVYYKGDNKAFGFCMGNSWVTLDSRVHWSLREDPEDWTEATDDEVRTRLVEYLEEQTHPRGTDVIFSYVNGQLLEYKASQDKSVLHFDVKDGGKWKNLHQLPVIARYNGEYDPEKDTIKYGCAELRVSWFQKSVNRHIASMVLSSGIVINETQMQQIRKFLDQVPE